MEIHPPAAAALLVPPGRARLVLVSGGKRCRLHRPARRVAVIDGGAVIAEGTPDQLKASVGGEHLNLVLAAGSDLAAAITAVQPYATGRVQPDPAGLRLSVPVAAARGLTTRVVRALDLAGVQVYHL